MKKMILSVIAGMALSTGASAAHWTGKVKIIQTLADHYYGGVMLRLNKKDLGGGCKHWVSLDMSERYFKHAKNREKAALTAFSMDKTVNLYIYPSAKHNGYCVARRIDVYNQ